MDRTAIERGAKKNQELNNQLVAANYECQISLFQLKTLVIKLATDLSLMEFWWCYKSIAEKDEPENTDLIKQYSDDSNTSSKNAIECRQHINEKFAEYYACVMKFSILANKDIADKKISEIFSAIDFEKAPLISVTDYDGCQMVYEKNKRELSDKYVSYLDHFKQLNEEFHNYTFTKLKSDDPLNS